MRISIKYFLYTDGDYCLDNAEVFGCTGREVVDEYDDYFDYVGSAEFHNESDVDCKTNAIDFLWRFLCDGIRVSYTHAWLLKDFYNIIEELVDQIDLFDRGTAGARRSLSGNHSATRIEIEITDNEKDEVKNMFELQSRTFYDKKFTLGHAVVFMNRNNHAAKFEVIFAVDENGKWSFHYENNACLNVDERIDFENWFTHEVMKI